MILVIANLKEDANCVCEMMSYMGVLSYGIKAKDAFSEISDLYRAVLILSPSEIPSPESYLKELLPYLNNVPLFALGKVDTNLLSYFSDVYSNDTYLSETLLKIVNYSYENDIPRPGEYKLSGIDLSYGLSVPKYYDQPFNLTRTQSMIVRFLIRSYPTPMPAEDILKYAYKESRMPELSNIRTHLSIINKKFRKQTGRNLIQPLFSRGYVIMTPEMSLLHT